jgi:thiol-disulfide isomerase/thioredoxin
MELMNKKLIPIIIIILVLIGGGFAYLMAQGDTDEPQASTTEQTDDMHPHEDGEMRDHSETEPDTQSSAGTYTAYSAEAVANTDGTKVLFFHAPWCPQCRSVESDILAEGVPAGVTIIKVDYDSRQDLRQQYGVTLQTTFVEVDAGGAELQKHVAYDDPHLDAVIAAML